jgi:TRAP transporter TAXI family solute receptor
VACDRDELPDRIRLAAATRRPFNTAENKCNGGEVNDFPMTVAENDARVAGFARHGALCRARPAQPVQYRSLAPGCDSAAGSAGFPADFGAVGSVWRHVALLPPSWRRFATTGALDLSRWFDHPVIIALFHFRRMCILSPRHRPRESTAEAGGSGVRVSTVWAVVLVAVLAAAGTGGRAAAQDLLQTDTLSIGTGTVSGVYLPAGGAICTMVNRSRKTSGVHCVVAPTEGSVANLEALRAGHVDFAIAQSDVVGDAAFGRDRFAPVGPDETLRSVFALHSETLSIVVTDESDIDDFDGLKGKRVAIGPVGSGQRVVLDLLLAARGWTLSDFAAVVEVAPTEEADVLCDGKVDAAIYMAGNPTGLLQEATTSCDTEIVPVPADLVAMLVRDNPALRPAVVPGGLYRDTPEDIPTIGTVALLVTTTNESVEHVYLLVRAVFENLAIVNSLHPALSDLKPKDMVQQPFPVPLHEGALRYYRERGWR